MVVGTDDYSSIIDWHHHRYWWWVCRSTIYLYIILIDRYPLQAICYPKFWNQMRITDNE